MQRSWTPFCLVPGVKGVPPSHCVFISRTLLFLSLRPPHCTQPPLPFSRRIHSRARSPVASRVLMSFVEHLSVKREGKISALLSILPSFFCAFVVENRHVLERIFRFRAGRRKYEISFDIVGQNGFFAKIVSFSRGVVTRFSICKESKEKFWRYPFFPLSFFRVSLLRGMSTIVESNGGFIYIFFLQKRRLLALSVLRVWILIVVVFWRKMQRFRVLFAGLTGVESVALDEARRRRLERGDRVLSHTTMLHTWSLTSSNTVS